MNTLIRSVFSFVKDQIYPNRCPCCGRLQSSEEICFGCRALIRRVGEDSCKSCGYETIFCACSVRPMQSDGFTAPFYNTGRASVGIKRLKYRGAVKTADFFALNMAQRFKAMFPDVDIDVVCGVPAGRSTLYDRGYNQAALLAEKTAKHLNIPCKNDLLIKVGENKPQHTLKRRDRAANVKGVYAVNDSVKGMNVLVVDDIRTTGATLNECARILKKAKAKKIYALSALTGRNLQ